MLSNRPVYSLIIINKAGGLIYQREFHPGLHKLSTNDYLVLAGTFHGYVFANVLIHWRHQGGNLKKKKEKQSKEKI